MEEDCDFWLVGEVGRLWEELRGGEMTIRIYSMKKFIFNKNKVLFLMAYIQEREPTEPIKKPRPQIY